MPQTCWIAPYSLNRLETDFVLFLSEDGRGGMRSGEVLFSSCPCEEFISADWLAVRDTCYADFETSVPKERRILFLMEPPEIRRYEKSYLECFGVVVSPYDIEGFTGKLIRDNPCLGWWAGISAFKNLSDVENFRTDKTRTLSIISSLKGKTEGHLKRLRFLNALMEHYGPKADYYGREFAPVGDKIDAIAPYKYHIAVENCCLENYWTEKLADAWVGWSLPIYCGDPSIASKIPDPAGIEIIDIDDIPAALRRIDALLEDDVYDSRRDAIGKCREWALKKASCLERICEIIAEADEPVKVVPRLESREEIESPGLRRKRHFFRALFLKICTLQRELQKKFLRRKIRRNYLRIKSNVSLGEHK